MGTKREGSENTGGKRNTKTDKYLKKTDRAQERNKIVEQNINYKKVKKKSRRGKGEERGKKRKLPRHGVAQLIRQGLCHVSKEKKPSQKRAL